MSDELLTTAELCEWLKVTREGVWKWRKEGMPYIGGGRFIRFRKDEVLRWLEERYRREE